MIHFAVCLIDSLMILSKLGIIKGYGNITGQTLYRGLNIETKLLEKQLWQRSRWTSFTSVSKNVSVAKQFGTPYMLKHDRTLRPETFETLFDISKLSEFPNEDEYVMLPGIHISSWGDNNFLWVGRKCVANKIAMSIHQFPKFIIKSGWLLKQSNILKQWHKRYVTLCKLSNISYDMIIYTFKENILNKLKTSKNNSDSILSQLQMLNPTDVIQIGNNKQRILVCEKENIQHTETRIVFKDLKGKTFRVLKSADENTDSQNDLSDWISAINQV